MLYLHNGKTTDNLIKEQQEITAKPNKREYDVLLSVGEQITIAKLAMCLHELGHDAISFTGWQLPIFTNEISGDANIEDINIDKILYNLNRNKIVIIAGFQGIDKNMNITTLGRGGSDTTAVTIAGYLKADKCDIYTDVDGIYNKDPRVEKDAKKFSHISYNQMLELANNGAKVMHNKSIETGKRFKVPIYVKSTFENDSIGTLIS